jgi:adenylate cyclase
VPDTVPAVSNRARAIIRDNYLTAPGHKALAISPRQIGFLTGQPDENYAKAGALAACQTATDSIPGPPFRCELFAVGDIVVSPRGHPPLPPEPWLARDPAIERPFAAADVPLALTNARNAISERYAPGPTPKALALAPNGYIGFYFNQSSHAEAVRRALEFCGMRAGIPCAIVAVDNVFTVAIPSTMKPTGFFRPATESSIAATDREALARRFADSPGGWRAVAVGSAGRAGLSLAARSEGDAITGALADCGAQDKDCRVIAIGIFTVEAK